MKHGESNIIWIYATSSVARQTARARASQPPPTAAAFFCLSKRSPG